VIGSHYKLKGKCTRPGVYKCKDCRKPFRVTVGTIFEASHIRLTVWLQAVFLIAIGRDLLESMPCGGNLTTCVEHVSLFSERHCVPGTTRWHCTNAKETRENVVRPWFPVFYLGYGFLRLRRSNVV
jgi:hypothetical protein